LEFIALNHAERSRAHLHGTPRDGLSHRIRFISHVYHASVPMLIHMA